MKINIGRLDIVTYNDKDKEIGKKQYKFIKKLDRDREISRYVPTDVKGTLLASKSVERIEDGYAFLIEKDGKPIGFIQIYSNFRNIYLINYGIGRQYRKKGYGTLLLEETSRYLLDNVNCNGVRLNILEDNIGSNLCALNAGFTLGKTVSKCINTYEKMK